MLRNLWLARSTLLAFARSRVALLPLLAGVTFLGGTFPLSASELSSTRAVTQHRRVFAEWWPTRTGRCSKVLRCS
jgi:hypothetical protein